MNPEKVNSAGYASTAENIKDVMALQALRLLQEISKVGDISGDRRERSSLRHAIKFLDQTSQDSSRLLTPEAKQPHHEKIAKLEHHIKDRLSKTDVELPLQKLTDIFKLTTREVELLVLSLASELDARFGRVFALLHDNADGERMTAGLAARIAGSHWSESAGLRKRCRQFMKP